MAPVEFTIVNIGALSLNKYWGETERVRPASATCTLLESAGRRLLVDPSPQPDLLEPMLFARTGLRPDAVDAVFLTHFHGDHAFGLELFEGKQWLMAAAGIEEWKTSAPDDKRADLFQPAEGALPAGIEAIPTPGHSRAHHSLRAPTKWGTLIVAGDAVMTPDFFDAEDGFHNSVDFAQVARTIQEIKRTAHIVIPGHGNILLNTPKGQG